MADELSGFLVTEKDGTTHLPTRKNGAIDHGLMGAAKAALTSPGGHRGSKYEGPNKAEAIAKLKALYKSEGMEWSETAAAEGAEERFAFVAVLGPMAETGAARLPILVSGDWVKAGREVCFSKDDLETAIGNFQKLANHDLNVDYDHACEELERAAGGPTPSAGRIVSLDPLEEYTIPSGRRAGQKCWILYGRYEPTQEARELVKKREYRYTSAAFRGQYPDRTTGESQGLTLTSVALTNQPFLDELPEIWLSVSGTRGTGNGTRENPNPESRTPSPEISDRPPAEIQGGKGMGNLTLKHSPGADGSHQITAHNPDDSKAGDIDYNHFCHFAAQHGRFSAADIGAEGNTAEQLSEIVRTAKDDRVKLAAAERERASRTELGKIYLADTVNEDAADQLLCAGTCTLLELRAAERARKRVDAAMAAGKILPVDRSVAFSVAVSDGAAFDAWIAKRPASERFTSKGIAGDLTTFSNVQEEIGTRAHALMVERKLPTMAKATEVLLSEDRDLYNRYRNSQPNAAARQ